MTVKEDTGRRNVVSTVYTDERTGQVSRSVQTVNWSNRIEYDDGPIHHPDGSTNWKRCVHTWNQSLSPCGLRGRMRNRWDSYLVDWLYPSWNTWGSYVRSGYSRVKPATAAEMLHEAEYAMQGRLNQTLLPITDLVQLFRKVDGLGAADAIMTSLLAPFRAKPKTWSDLVKKVAGADLARKFGVQTLMTTLTDAIQIGKVIENHLRKLERIQNSQQRNFKVTVNDRYVGGSMSQQNFAGNWEETLVKADAEVGGIASTSIHFRTSVRYDTSDALRTRLVWDALGLSNLFSTAWDLMPLSFVIDWFVRVQEFVARVDSYYFHTVPLERMAELQDVWITKTVKGYVEFKNFTPQNRGGWSTSLTNVPESWKLEMGRFEREPLDPSTTSAWLPSLQVGGSNLTLAQTVTGLELMVQRSF